MGQSHTSSDDHDQEPAGTFVSSTVSGHITASRIELNFCYWTGFSSPDSFLAGEKGFQSLL